MPTIDELRILQNLPLELKIAKTKLRIHEWVNHYGKEGVYVSFSGGKDSTVLLDLVRQEYPDIPAVFVDTGLEYPEIKQFIKTFENVTKLRPKKNFKQVIEEYGYPIISKEVCHKISGYRNGSKWAFKFWNGDKDSRFNVPKKWKNFATNYPDIKISNRCYVMKKAPAHTYGKQTGRNPILGTTCEESALRTQQWLFNGCNAFNNNNPVSNPMSFWTEQDVLQYIYEKKLPIASVYGDVICEKGKYRTTGVSRTGCVFCGFGVHREKEPNRYQLLYKTHPKLWEYCMKPVEEGGLGFQYVMDAIGVKTKPDEDLFTMCERK